MNAILIFLYEEQSTLRCGDLSVAINLKKKIRIHVIAQSHIDLAWWWQFDPETINVCTKLTFGAATDHMDRFSDYHFSQSQVPLYRATEQIYPEIFSKIEKYIKEGRWEIVGGMFCEAEGGEPCGESLVRQIIYGKKYWKERFGVDVKTGWQEDSWTHPWQLPQIMKKAGIEYYMFIRCLGSYTHPLFWWESPDGSRILAHRPMLQQWNYPNIKWKLYAKKMAKKFGISDVMIMIGKGDHGGGPKTHEIEKILKFRERNKKNFDLTFNRFDRYMDLISSSNDLPVLKTELAHELVGDLTNVGEIKREHRELEQLLLSTEKWAALALLISPKSYSFPQKELDDAWELLLFNQFHDIIGGSGLLEVHQDAFRDFARIRNLLAGVWAKTKDSIIANVSKNSEKDESEVDSVVIFNSLSWDRTEHVEIELDNNKSGRYILEDSTGKRYSYQIIEKEPTSKRYLLAPVNLPSFGFITLHIDYVQNLEGKSNQMLSENAGIMEKAEHWEIHSKYFEIKINKKTGNIFSIHDIELNKELVKPGCEANALISIKDLGDSEGYLIRKKPLLAKLPFKPVPAQDPNKSVEIRIKEYGSIRFSIEISKAFKNSKFIQEIICYSEEHRIDFHTILDWHDTQQMIKVQFPLNIESGVLTCDSAYVAIVRPTDGNEYSMQKWIDLSCPEFGVSLLNYARYGYDCMGSNLRLTLLRSPIDPVPSTDEGIHHIWYSLIPHRGSWKESKIMQLGYQFNNPICESMQNIAYFRSMKLNIPTTSYFTIDAENVILECLKPPYSAEQGSVILRLFEFHGTSTVFNIRSIFHFKAVKEVNLLEEKFNSDLDKDQNRFGPNSSNEITIQIGAYEIKTLKIDLVMNSDANK